MSADAKRDEATIARIKAAINAAIKAVPGLGTRLEDLALIHEALDQVSEAFEARLEHRLSQFRDGEI